MGENNLNQTATKRRVSLQLSRFISDNEQETEKSSEAPTGGPEDAKVVDAEFEEVDPNEDKEKNKK